ncbi:MAG: 30S ribosome-binding factor RbfA [Gemmataceae bacterium]|nr:30S ribosome-binding factor RbfA [Gemmataceae bacterium]
MKSHRLARVSEVVRETAANAILFEIKDPRVKGVTVTRAEVSADLQHAKVFVSLMGTEREQNLTMHGLKSAAGYVQTKLADRLTSRYVPHITFIVDEGVKKSIEIARIIREEQERRDSAGGRPQTDVEDETGSDEDNDEAGAEGEGAPTPTTEPRADGSTDRPHAPAG